MNKIEKEKRLSGSFLFFCIFILFFLILVYVCCNFFSHKINFKVFIQIFKNLEKNNELTFCFVIKCLQTWKKLSYY